MKQSRSDSPLYRPLLEALLADLEPIVAEVSRDVARAGEDPAGAAPAARRAIEHTIRGLLAAEELGPADLAAMHDEGARAAREGESLQLVLDRYLTAGWVLWGAATRQVPPDVVALSALGTALLKAGDAAAAVLAAGYGAAEREIAARTASARREFVDELLELTAGDREAIARVTRRAAHFGLDPSASYRLVVAGIGRDVDDESPEVDRIVRLLSRPARSLAAPVDGRGAVATPGATGAPIVATKRERLVIIVRTDWPLVGLLDDALRQLVGGDGWTAVETSPADGLAGVGVAFAPLLGSLLVAERLGIRGRRLDADELLLERALLADEALLAAAVRHELGPILHAPRSGAELVATLEAFLSSGQNVRATARVLQLAPRTVSYRLERIERLLGAPLTGERLARISAVLFARRLVSGPAGRSR